MGVRFECDLTGEEFDKEDLYSEIIPVRIVASNFNNMTHIGGFHLKMDELPEQLRSDAQQGAEPMVQIIVSGEMTPVTKQNQIVSFKYQSNNPESIGVNLSVKTGERVKSGQIVTTNTYNTTNPQVSEFLEKVDGLVKETCQYQDDRAESIVESNQPSGRTYH